MKFKSEFPSTDLTFNKSKTEEYNIPKTTPYFILMRAVNRPLRDSIDRFHCRILGYAINKLI